MTFQHIFLRNLSVSLIASGCFVAIGGIIFLYGIFLSKQTVLPWHLRSTWKQYLSKFRINRTLDEDEAMHLAQRQWLRWLGATFMGMGIGVLAGVGAMWLLVLMTLHLPFGLPLGAEMFIFMPVYWSILIGFMIGGFIASRKRGFSGFDEPSADGSPSRHILDYRSPLLVFIVATPFLVYSGVTLILAPRYVAFSAEDMRDFGIIPPPHWILALYPCALLLTLIIAEACVWIELKTLAPIRSQDSALARDLNTGMIQQQMAKYYSVALISCFIAGQGIVQIFASRLDDAGFGWLIFASLLLYVACFGLLGTLVMSQGRMGGRLTGWPWSKERARRAMSAEG